MGILAGFKITMGYVPKQGARALLVPLKFNSLGVTTISQDFFKEQSQGELEFVQSAYIDNSANAMGLAIKFAGLQQTITLRTQMQGYFPLFLPNGQCAFTAVTLGNVDVYMILSNVFVNPSVWQSA